MPYTNNFFTLTIGSIDWYGGFLNLLGFSIFWVSQSGGCLNLVGFWTGWLCESGGFVNLGAFLICLVGFGICLVSKSSGFLNLPSGIRNLVCLWISCGSLNLVGFFIWWVSESSWWVSELGEFGIFQLCHIVQILGLINNLISMN